MYNGKLITEMLNSIMKQSGAKTKKASQNCSPNHKPGLIVVVRRQKVKLQDWVNLYLENQKVLRSVLHCWKKERI